MLCELVLVMFNLRNDYVVVSQEFLINLLGGFILIEICYNERLPDLT